MITSLRRHWPLAVALLALWLSVVVLLAISLWQNQGHLVYALDDAYIHLAIARNLATHGVWGITPYGWTSSSSSLLWPLALSLWDIVLDPSYIAPFVFNLILATGVLVVVYRLLQPHHIASRYLIWVLLAITFLTSIPALLFTGLEHILHLLLTIMVVYLSGQLLAGSLRVSRKREVVSLLLLGPLLTMTRYEGCFLIAIVCVLFAIRRSWLIAFALALLSVLPLVVYAAIAQAHGWPWLPVSIVLKSSVGALNSPTAVVRFLFGWLRLFANPHLLVLNILAIIFMVRNRERGRGGWEPEQIGLGIFVALSLLHLEFAQVGWFFRYEAYLVALGLFVLARPICSTVANYAGAFRQAVIRGVQSPLNVLVLLLGCTLVLRGVIATASVPRATTNIYDQQYQMGRFLQRYYSGAAVAVNDIGAVNFLADIHCLDVWGLASNDVYKARRSGTYSTAFIAELARTQQVRIAIVYDSWFQNSHSSFLPSSWIKVAQWHIRDNLVAGSDTVSFYAVVATEEDQLRAHLQDFLPLLPPGTTSTEIR